MDRDLLTSKEVAQMLGVHTSTLRRWRMGGVGPAYHQLGGRQSRCRYRLADVERWLRCKRHRGEG